MGDNNTTPTYRTMKLGFAFLAFLAIVVIATAGEADWQEDHDVSPHHSTYAQVTELYDSMLQKTVLAKKKAVKKVAKVVKKVAQKKAQKKAAKKVAKVVKKKVALKKKAALALSQFLPRGYSFPRRRLTPNHHYNVPCNKFCQMNRNEKKNKAKCRRRRTSSGPPLADQHPECVKQRKASERIARSQIRRRRSAPRGGGGGTSGGSYSHDDGSGRRRSSSTSYHGGSAKTSGGSGSKSKKGGKRL